MTDVTVTINRATKKIVRTSPPELLKTIQCVEGTTLVVIPSTVFDLGTMHVVPVNFRFTDKT